MFGAMPSRFIPRQKVGDSAPSRPLLTVGVGERVPVVIADDEAVRVVLNLLRSREAERMRRPLVQTWLQGSGGSETI
jgi:hypothetical protein